MITAAQCRAARALIRWNAEDLAEKAQVSLSAIRLFELEQSSPRRATMAAIERALVDAGVEFIPENGGGAGVRLRLTIPREALLAPLGRAGAAKDPYSSIDDSGEPPADQA